MLEFVRERFRGLFIFGLWVCIILFVIGGGIYGYTLGGGFGAFIGIIIGVLLGLFFIIIGGGFVATFLNIDENLEKQNSLLKDLIKINNQNNNRLVENNRTNETNSNIKPESNKNGDFELTEDILLRAAANDTASSICKLEKGTIVFSKSKYKQFEYHYVNTSDGKQGWIMERYLKKII